MPVKRNINQNWNDQIGDNMFGFSSNNQEITSPNLAVTPEQQQYFSGTNPGAYGSGDWRSNMNQLYNWSDSGARYNYDRPYNMRDVAGEVGEYSQKPGHGIMATDAAQKKGFNFSNFPSLLLNMANYRNPLRKTSANYNPALQGQIEDLNKINFLSGSEGQTGPYRITGGPLAGKNLVSGFGTNDYDQMLAKKAAWFQARKDADKGFSQKNWDAVIKEQEARAGENTARGDGARSFDPSGPTQASIRRERADKSGSGHRGGFTDPGRDSYGPHKRADGGRIGYQDGELVEQETDFIQGPYGDEEFQETVVEGQEQPSREQLEALAMEIFNAPLEELDDEQLLVVYQEAMQGQPMEEAVQEEDVQFAANGGLAGLL